MRNNVEAEKSLDQLYEEYGSIEALEEVIGLEKLLEYFKEVKEDPVENGEGGVLLSNEIENYVRDFRLIFPFSKKNLKPASYKLTVGNEYALGGKIRPKLGKNRENEIKIPPFEVAIIKTREIINMPRFLIGRWNIRVTQAYRGLLWVGGPQVDPGWVGHLFCPIYNLSNREVVLKLGEELATIDFVRTTSFVEGCKEFDREESKKHLKDYNYWLESALFTEAGQRIEEIEKKANRIESLVGLSFTSIVVLFAALTILVTSGWFGTGVTTSSEPVTIPTSVIGWAYFSLPLSIIAIAISLFARVKLEIKEQWKKVVVIAFYLAYVVASIIALAIVGTEYLL